jgi:hypothetical protein
MGQKIFEELKTIEKKNKNDHSDAIVLVFYFMANLHFSPSSSFIWSFQRILLQWISSAYFLLSVARLSLSLSLSHTHTHTHTHTQMHIIFLSLMFSNIHLSGFSLDSHQLIHPRSKVHRRCYLSQTLLNLNGLLLQPGR